MKMRKAFVRENGFILKIILNVLQKECIPMNGKKTGTWKYYNEDGSTRSIENYETGEVNVYRDGVLAQHFFLKDDKINGHVELFDACGTPNETLNYDKGRRHGSGKIMYSSGKIKSTYYL